MKIWIVLLLVFLNINHACASEAIEKFQHTWLANALRLQREVDLNVPLNHATIIGTHNSYNSLSYQTMFRYLDPNQIYSIYEQLELGVRSLEFDAHWYPTANFSNDILLCHGRGNHIGCSLFDRPIEEGLEELRNWLSTHPHEIILLYIERHLDGHEPRMAALLEKYLDQYLYKPTQIRTPSAESCLSLPSETLTKADILKTGKQVVVVAADCDEKNTHYAEQDRFKQQWYDFVFAGIGTMRDLPFTFIDSDYNKDVTPYPDCSQSTIFKADPTHSSVWRIYDELISIATVKHPLHRITPNEMRDLARCNINWPSVDKLEINDDRLFATIWGWENGYPQAGAGQCAMYKRGTIINIPCAQALSHFACQHSILKTWRIVNANASWQDGETLCQSLAGNAWHFATPINGSEMYQLTLTATNAVIAEAALNYHEEKEGHWIANNV